MDEWVLPPTQCLGPKTSLSISNQTHLHLNLHSGGFLHQPDRPLRRVLHVEPKGQQGGSGDRCCDGGRQWTAAAGQGVKEVLGFDFLIEECISGLGLRVKGRAWRGE